MRSFFFSLLVLVAIPRTASAIACTNDIDCPAPACGGEVCQHGATNTCVAAGSVGSGAEGWCTASTDCKCMGSGATCNTSTHYCSVTVATDMANTGPFDFAGEDLSDDGTSTDMANQGPFDLAVASDAATSTGAPRTGGSGCAFGGTPRGAQGLFCLIVLVLGMGLRRNRHAS